MNDSTPLKVAQRPRQAWLSPRLLRDLHLYLAVFFAPTLIFFAATGAAQLFGLHEASRDGGYAPPPVVEKLAEVHIHQRFAAPPRRGPPPSATARPAPAPQAATAPAIRPPNPILAKVFFLAMSLGLIVAAGLGLWIGIAQGRRRKLSLVLALLGLFAPAALIALQ